MKKVMLNLGCGSNTRKDWINIDLSSKNPDVVHHNLMEGIPFDDNSVDVIYHSHVLEHFTRNDASNFLKECHRVLRVGGIIRVCVPDLEQIAQKYLLSLEDALEHKPLSKENYDWMMLEMLDQTTRNESGGEMSKFLQQPELNNEDFVFQRVGDEARHIREHYLRNINLPVAHVGFTTALTKHLRQAVKSLLPKKLLQEIKIGRFRNGGEIHQWMYDQYSLSRALEESGFYKIKCVTENESLIPNWATHNLDISSNGKARKPDSLYMEAIKK